VLFSAAFATLVVVAAWKRSHRLHTLLVRCAAWCALAALLLNLAALTTYAASACFHPNQWTFAGHSDTTAWAFGAGPFLCVLCSGLDGVAALPLMFWRVIRKVRCHCHQHSPSPYAYSWAMARHKSNACFLRRLSDACSCLSLESDQLRETSCRAVELQAWSALGWYNGAVLRVLQSP
jgi:hypothetical protein